LVYTSKANNNGDSPPPVGGGTIANALPLSDTVPRAVFATAKTNG